ncbi:MAG: sigma-70 family RNA polymerase sigma factor [Polyangiaceae bacterium]|nr:sigma-70 family RNA polymerase sigma factor [Polyangiaceae bacterium]
MSSVAGGAAGAPDPARQPRATSERSDVTACDQPPKPNLQSVHQCHFDFLCRCLRALGVHPEAIEDAAQETLIVVHRRLPEYEPRTPLRGWLFRIASHVARNYRRSVRRRRHHEKQGTGLQARTLGPEAAVQGREAAQLVERFVDGLGEGKRAVFVLALLEALPAPEVAAALDIPLNTVYSRVRALRRRFRAMLAQHYREDLR